MKQSSVDKLNPLMVMDSYPAMIKNIETVRGAVRSGLISKQEARQLISDAIQRYKVGIPT